MLELISPGGFEQLFRRLMEHPVEDPADLAELAREYQCDIDLEATGGLLERHTEDFWF